MPPQLGSTAVGIQVADGVLLAVEKRITSPLLFDTTTQAQFFLPIATSLAFGIVFATVVSLLVLPCLYLVGRDLGALVGGETRPLQPIPAPPPEVEERASWLRRSRTA